MGRFIVGGQGQHPAAQGNLMAVSFPLHIELHAQMSHLQKKGGIIGIDGNDPGFLRRIRKKFTAVQIHCLQAERNLLFLILLHKNLAAHLVKLPGIHFCRQSGIPAVNAVLLDQKLRRRYGKGSEKLSGPEYKRLQGAGRAGQLCIRPQYIYKLRRRYLPLLECNQILEQEPGLFRRAVAFTNCHVSYGNRKAAEHFHLYGR